MGDSRNFITVFYSVEALDLTMALTFKVYVDEELFKLTTHSIALTSQRHLRIMSMAATVRDALKLFVHRNATQVRIYGNICF